MLSKDCKGCKYCVWMVALGLGIRCSHEENQKYKPKDEKLQNLPVVISHITENCEFYQKLT